VELDQERLAIHEGAHIAAAILLDRPVDNAWINSNGGGAVVGTTKPDAPISLEDALTDILLMTIGDVADPSVSGRYYLVDEHPGSDEDRALSVAMRVTGSAEEARAIVQLGRARAKSLSEHPAFIRLASRFASELMERDLNAEDIERIREECNGART
jgi:hypothetical protein